MAHYVNEEDFIHWRCAKCNSELELKKLLSLIWTVLFRLNYRFAKSADRSSFRNPWQHRRCWRLNNKWRINNSGKLFSDESRSGRNRPDRKVAQPQPSPKRLDDFRCRLRRRRCLSIPVIGRISSDRFGHRSTFFRKNEFGKNSRTNQRYSHIRGNRRCGFNGMHIEYLADR